MVLADVVMRKLPGALGHEQSAVEESFSQRARRGCRSIPTTRAPPAYRGWQVPDVLVSGDHERVRSWRVEQSRMRAAEFDRGAE